MNTFIWNSNIQSSVNNTDCDTLQDTYNYEDLYDCKMSVYIKDFITGFS